jgi:hypothetical protein
MGTSVLGFFLPISKEKHKKEMPKVMMAMQL